MGNCLAKKFEKAPPKKKRKKIRAPEEEEQEEEVENVVAERQRRDGCGVDENQQDCNPTPNKGAGGGGTAVDGAYGGRHRADDARDGRGYSEGAGGADGDDDKVHGGQKHEERHKADRDDGDRTHSKEDKAGHHDRKHGKDHQKSPAKSDNKRQKADGKLLHKRKFTPAWRQRKADDTPTTSSATPSILILPDELLQMIVRHLSATIDAAAMMATCIRLHSCIASIPNFWPTEIKIFLGYNWQLQGFKRPIVDVDRYCVNEMKFDNPKQMESAAEFVMKYGKIDTVLIATAAKTDCSGFNLGQGRKWLRIETDVFRRMSSVVDRHPTPSVRCLCVKAQVRPDYNSVALIVRRLSHSLQEFGVDENNITRITPFDPCELAADTYSHTSHSAEQCVAAMVDAIGCCKKLRKIILRVQEYCHTVPLDHFRSTLNSLPDLEMIEINPRLLPPTVNGFAPLLNEANGNIRAVGLTCFTDYGQVAEHDYERGYHFEAVDTLVETYLSNSARMHIRRLTGIPRDMCDPDTLHRLLALLPKARELSFNYCYDYKGYEPEEEKRAALTEAEPLRMAFLRRHKDAVEPQHLLIRYKDTTPDLWYLRLKLTKTYREGNATVEVRYNVNEPPIMGIEGFLPIHPSK